MLNEPWARAVFRISYPQLGVVVVTNNKMAERRDAVLCENLIMLSNTNCC